MSLDSHNEFRVQTPQAVSQPVRFQQQLQPVLRAERGEVVDQFGESRWEAHPRSSPCAIGTRTALPHSVQLPS